jgi:hypothetical protein
VPTRILKTDPLDDASGERRRASGAGALAGRAGRLEVLAEEALEFGVRDQPLTPGRLHRVQHGHDAAVDCRDADAECLGGLFAAVGEAFGFLDLLQLARRRPDPFRLDAALAEELSFALFLAFRAQETPYSNSCVG